MRTTIALNYLIVSCLSQAWGFQAPTPAPASASDIHDVIARLTAARALPATAKDNADRIVGDALRDLALIGVLTGHVRSALTDVERQRLDKRVFRAC